MVSHNFGLQIWSFFLRKLLFFMLIMMNVACLSAEWKERGFVQWGGSDTPDNAYAEHWIDLGFEPEIAQRWRVAGFHAKEAKPFIEAGFEAAEAKRWYDADFLDPSVAAEWRAAAFKPADAARWSEYLGNPEKAAQWRDAELKNPEQLAEWEAADYSAEEALPWLQAGFASGSEARRWQKAKFEAPRAFLWNKFKFNPESAIPWIGVGIEPIQAREMVRNKVLPQHASRYVWLRKKRLAPEVAAPWVADFEGPVAFEWIRARFKFEDAVIFKNAQMTVSDGQKWMSAGFKSDDAVKWHDAEFSIPEAESWQRISFSPLKAGLWKYHGYSAQTAVAGKDCGHPSLVKELERTGKGLTLCQRFAKELAYLGELSLINVREAVSDLTAWSQGCFQYNETPADKRPVRPVIRSLRERRPFLYEAKLIDDQPLVFENARYKRFVVKPNALNEKSFVHRSAFKIDGRIAGYFKSSLEGSRLVLEECFF